jgi:hypothetical protein
MHPYFMQCLERESSVFGYLEFPELGTAAFDLIQESEAICDFSGDAGVLMIWKSVKSALDFAETLSAMDSGERRYCLVLAKPAGQRLRYAQFIEATAKISKACLELPGGCDILFTTALKRDLSEDTLTSPMEIGGLVLERFTFRAPKLPTPTPVPVISRSYLPTASEIDYTGALEVNPRIRMEPIPGNQGAMREFRLIAS